MKRKDHKNDSSAAKGASLAQQNALLLVVVFILFELMTAAAMVGFIMMPMARRAASNLAGLMVLSAQTWADLPPGTRPAFQQELAQNHALALRDTPPSTLSDDRHALFIHFLESALWERTGERRHMTKEIVADEEWHWALLPSGGGTIYVGFPWSSLNVQPFVAAALSLALGLVLALATAFWLARRTVAPLARLEEAATQVGQGEMPILLPETGPRELATLTRRFNDMARQVRDLLAARTTLMAGISHDLRSPLARMRLALALLEVKHTPERIAQMEADIEEMDRLIGNALDLARGFEQEMPQNIPLPELLNDLVAQCKRVTVSGCPAIFLHTPPLALRRTLRNLLENALRHGGDGSVELTAEVTDKGVRIGILDHGPGIPADQAEAVFQPFYRLDDSRNPTTGGAGLGLAIVRQLAQSNGWRVELAPRVGGGLAAWLTIPIGVSS